jgi:hypothetical protein
LLRRDGSDHWLLAGSHLRYGGLGDRCAPAAHQNFQTLQEISYAHTPGALHDDRLMKQQRAPGTLVAAKAGTVTAMNLDAVDLAVHLLATAHAQGQL